MSPVHESPASPALQAADVADQFDDMPELQLPDGIGIPTKTAISYRYGQ